MNYLLTQDIRLDANLYIPDGGELLLSIQVPREQVLVDANGPAKVTRVYSDHADGQWGVGEEIFLFVEFTSAVEVVGGTPSLVLRTGCPASSPCYKREVQRLRCQATAGKFSVGFAGEKVFNIPYDANQRMLAEFLTRMTQLDKVKVQYSISDAACTFFGNNITITFESVNIDGTDGDLPELTADKDNVGGVVGTNLFHIRFAPMMTTQAWEIQKGNKVPHRVANFVDQPNPKTLRFLYTVRPGDNATRLEYVNSDSLALSLQGPSAPKIYNANSQRTVLVNAKLPPPGFAGDWEKGIGSSLSATNNLKIDVSRPVITGVTSPHVDGTFGIGEAILIHVAFSQPIVVKGSPTLVLETGLVDRIIPFVQVLGSDTIAQFSYIVQSKDTSPDLAYAGTSVLELNGGSIKRKSSTPTTDAILTLPVNGEKGSLSVNKNIVIDTTNPEVLSVTSTTPNGVYTVGDTIEMIVAFEAPIVVTGNPSLLLNTGKVDLYPGFFVQAAPSTLGATSSKKKILFPPVNHGLSTLESRGTQFEIDGQVLTLDSVNGDEVTFVEDYTGTIVNATLIAANGGGGVGSAIAIKTPGYRQAVYVSGSGTATLVFRYKVQRGDVSLDLDYLSTSALQVSIGGSIKRLSTNPVTDADLTLPTPGAANSLGLSSVIVIDTNAPRILQANSITHDGVYRAGDSIKLALVFDLPVVVLGTASLLVSVTQPERYAVYNGRGSGTTTLEFEFIVDASDQASVFDFVDTKSLKASVGSIFGDIRRKAMTPMLSAILDLPVGGLSSKGISINQNCVYVNGVTSTHEDATIGAGEVVNLLVQFSANVDVDVTAGVPTLVLTTLNAATYVSGTGTSVLTFRYIVAINDIPSRLNYNGIYALRLNGGGGIRASSNQQLASIVLPPPETSGLALQSVLTIDTSPPRVQFVATKALDGVYTVGDRLVVYAKFNFPIDVASSSSGTGIPILLLSAGVDKGVQTQFVASEDDKIYFAYTVASGQSIATQSYFSRVALKCVNNAGMNQDPTQDASLATSAALGVRVFIAWSEVSTATAKSQVRVKSFDAQMFPPLWVSEDGGSSTASSVQFDATQAATAPMLVIFASKLYLMWQEASSSTNNPWQIRVAVYLGLVPSGAGVQQWSLVDRKPTTTLGINRDPAQSAAAPSLISHSGKLYAAWHEVSATSSVSQIRVAVYNGQDLTPLWSFVDGNVVAKGINYAPLNAAQDVKLGSCVSQMNGAGMVLYAAWEETEATSGAQQIRVAAFTGTDTAPKWVFVDGNTAFGVNYNTAASARAPSVMCIGSALIVAWHEALSTALGAAPRVRVKWFNGNLASPLWKSLDRNIGLNFNPSQSAMNVRLRMQPAVSSSLFAVWEEMDALEGKSQVRIASFTGTLDSPLWAFLDGARSTSSINDDFSKSASRPVLLLSPVPQFSWFVFWHELQAPTDKTHVRGSALGTEIAQWQSLHYACIRRKSSTPMTVANLLLPELSAPGSLDFGRAIRIDTSAPFVRSVTLSGDIARVMSTALVVQTVDVFNQASLAQGSFKLIYGESYETACIDWGASAETGATSMKTALETIDGLALSVSVVKDTSAFHDGHRYLVTFLFPSMGLQPLRVKELSDDDGCTPFACLPTALFTCSLKNLIKVNANADVTFRPGVLDALVQFSFPVVVLSTVPTKLTLETGAVDTDAPYTSRSALQEFDVGTDAPSPILRGSFRLIYGDFSNSGTTALRTTECIDIPLKDEDGVQELYEKLQAATPELVTIGISQITRERLRNGYRYRVLLRNSVDLLDLVPGDASSCPQFAGRTQTIDVFSSSQILQGEFKVQFGDVTSGCIPWNLRATGGGSAGQPTTSLQNILSTIVPNRVVPVVVTKDPSVFTQGHRYYLDFLMLDDAVEELLVFQDAPTCAAFACDDGAGGSTACTGLQLAVNADFKAKRAASDTVSFRYLVQPTDDTAVLTYRDASALSGNIVRASKTPSVVASLALPVPTPPLCNALGAEVTIVSEDLIPSVLRVYAATLDGEYTAGDEIVLFIQFSGAVLVQGFPILELNSKGFAVYYTGAGTDTLEFRYKVKSGESALALNYATQHSLVIANSNSYIRYYGSGNADDQSTLLDADLDLPPLASGSSLTGTSTITIDTSTPTIRSVSSLNTDTAVGAPGFGVGDILLLTVEFSKEVMVLGSGYPTMTLNSNAVTAIATFQYGGYRQLIDVGVHATYPLTSGQFAVTYGIKQSGCIDYNDANSNAATSMQSRLLEIDAVQRIGILSVTLLNVKNGHRFLIVFKSTQVLDLPLAIEPIVSDVCSPLLPSSDAPEKLLAKATDTIVTFQYPVGENQQSLDLDYTDTSLLLPDADTMILRRAKDPSILADLTLPAAGSPNRLGAKKNLVIDGTPIVVLDIVSDSAGGTYGVAFPPTGSPATVFPGEILFHLVFSRPVRVVGTPTVELATGSFQPNGVFLPNRVANYVDQPQPTQVAFLYHIQEGDFSANLAFANANVLSSAQIYGASTSSSYLANTLLPRLTVSGASTIRIDAYSVPTTVKLSSTHADGIFGAGEAIEIQVKFSKPVILQTGLNRNQDYFARHPVSLLFQGNVYVLWTEWEKLHEPTKSYLYLRVFSSTTLEEIPTAASPVVINRIPNSFIEKASMTAWNNQIYAAWDEDGLIYCAKYNGLAAVVAWTLIPNMGANKDMAMLASKPFLLVHNLILVMLWREMAVPDPTPRGNNSNQPFIGQIRVALRNDDIDAPLWIFHDGNRLNAGLNRDPRCDAKEPRAIVFQGMMFVAWLEARSDDPTVYEIVVARRNIINRDRSTWTYLDAPASTQPVYSFVSSHSPRFAVRRRGFEDAALLLTWYRDTEYENVTEVVTRVVSDSDWTMVSSSTLGSVPYILDGGRNPTVSSRISTQKLEIATCGDALYAVWMQDSPTNQGITTNVGVLSRPTDSVTSGWQSVYKGNMNQNQAFDAIDANLICSSTATAAFGAAMGLFWTEFDGLTTKLRFRHQRVPRRSPDAPLGTWEEVISGRPLLNMGTGTTPPGYAANTDFSGTESYVLSFIYIVKQGETAVNIDVLDRTALMLNGATIRDYLGQIPDCTLFQNANDLRSLSYNNKIMIDTSAPFIIDVTAETPSGEYGVGQRLVLQVVFSTAVAVTADVSTTDNLPMLYLRSDELHFLDVTVNPARYVSGSGSKVLTFEYITTELDYCERLDYFGSGSLVLLGDSKIQSNSTFPTTDVLLTLPAPKSPHSLSGNRAIAIKPMQPQVLQVTSPNTDGIYHPGDTIVLQVVFSLPVLVYGSPNLLLAVGRAGGKGAIAKFTSGNQTTTLSFTYAVAVGDCSADLDVVDDRKGNLKLNYVKSLDLAGRAQIMRLSTTPVTKAVVAVPAPGTPGSLSLTKNIVIDSMQPAIIDVRSGTSDGTFDVGDEIELLVEFSRNVVVIGIPFIKLNIAANFDRTAVYKSGSGSTVLRFTYTPVSGDNTQSTPLDIQDTESFILRPLLVGSEITQQPAQVLCAAQVPSLAANLKMPRPGVPLQVNSVRSLVGNSKKIFVRTDGLRVVDLQTDLVSGEVYSPGQQLQMSVIFSGPVIVLGAPRLKLNANALLPAYALYTKGSGTKELQFTYVVVSGDACKVLDAASRIALELNGGMITDTSSVYVPLRLGAPYQPGSLSFNYRIEISSIPPTVERVYAVSLNGTYGVGDEVQVAVKFTRRVTFLLVVAPTPVPAAPTLLLQLNAGVRTAVYASGDGTRDLVFKYRVQPGDSTLRLEYSTQNSLVGTLFAMATTPIVQVNTQLPVLGSTSQLSLSMQSQIQIDSSPPKVLRVAAIDRNGTYGLSDKLRFRVHFSYRVIVPAASVSSCDIELSLGNHVVRIAKYSGGSTTKTLEFAYTIAAGDRSGRLDYVAQDSLACSILQFSTLPSLAASTSLPLPGSEGSLSHSSDIHVDPTAPRITSVSSPLANGVYGAGQVIDITVSFSEAVTFLQQGYQPRLRLAIGSSKTTNGGVAAFASYVSGKGTATLTFRYTSREGDMALPLAYDGIDALSMDPPATGKLYATANGDPNYRLASLRLPVPMTTGSLSNNRDIQIDTMEPPRVISVGSSTPNGVYTAGDVLLVTTTFSTPVVVTGTPTLRLDTGNPDPTKRPGVASYISGSGTVSLVFQYTVQPGDHADRLDYQRCPDTERRAPKKREWDKLVICSFAANALLLGGPGSSIKRLATTPSSDAVLDLPEVSSWPKLRFHTSRDDFVYVDQLEATTDTLESERTLQPPLVNEFTISHQKASIRMYSNGIPDHPSSLLVDQSSNPSQVLIKEQRYFVELKRFPEQQSLPLRMDAYEGFVGMFLNGIPFKNASTVAVPTTLNMDGCGGVVDDNGRYFYSNLPTCYLANLGELPAGSSLPSIDPSVVTPPLHSASPIVGYAFDGFPIYGFYDENGELPADLDKCNGRLRADGQYCYHLVPPSSYKRSALTPCLRGIDESQVNSLLRVFKFPVDIRAVEGLSLANLSRFDGLVIDEDPSTLLTEKMWLNPEGVSTVYTSTSVIVRSDGMPNGQHGPFPNMYNPHSVKTQNYEFAFPRQPVVNPTTTTALPMDIPIGVMINGIPFFSSKSAVYGDNVMSSASPALLLLDKCNGLVDSGGDYRYYASPDCLLYELNADVRNKPSPLIGYAFDGFPLYGPYNEDGVQPKDLDECNGRIGYDGTYRYHVTFTFPYLIGCFRGTPSTDYPLFGNLYRSLSYSHDLRINTDAPRVIQVFTGKASTTFVAGETLDIVVQWSVPVHVDTGGGLLLPSIPVANSTQVAVFDASRSTSKTSVFIYKVSSDVGPFSFDYRTDIALDGAKIRRLAAMPTLDADLRLVSAESIPRFASKHQLVQNVKVTMRGLYHPQASDLNVRLFHEAKSAIVIANCCHETDAFGIPDKAVRVNREQLEVFPVNPTSGVGLDYSFQDLTGAKNLAMDGGATALQSSTSGACFASNAIDGHIDGLVSSQSVARTDAKPNQTAWWELRLVRNTEIGTVRLWVAKDESLPAVVQILDVNSNDAVSTVDGTFTLVFTASDGTQQTTAAISYNAVAMIIDEDPKIENLGIGKSESLQAKLGALAGMPQLFITRFPADTALSQNGAFSWSITFLSNPKLYGSREALPLLPLRVGVNSICGGTGVVKLTSPFPGEDADKWNYLERDDRAESVAIGKLSMFPFWIMLFADAAVMDFESFEEAYEAAIWVYRVNASASQRRVISVNPPFNMKVRYVRVIAEKPFARLTIAEVEVFKERSHLLSQYESGTPVATEYYPGAETWSPEDPFQAAFGAMTSEGTWTLAIHDSKVKQQIGEHASHGQGAISDWVLSVTNMAGLARTYYMDIKAHVKTLPRHGKLYLAVQETEADHLDSDRDGILDSIEANAYLSRYLLNYDVFPALLRKRALLGFLDGYEKFGGIEILGDASERQKPLPIACDARCLADIGLDLYFYTGNTGNVGLKLMEIVGDRVIKYVPNAEFRGRDAITFSISIGAQESVVLGTVELNVRECEDAACSMDMRFVHRNE